jgi:hypothetical protein
VVGILVSWRRPVLRSTSRCFFRSGMG